jgi:HlyD family secretion protein
METGGVTIWEKFFAKKRTAWAAALLLALFALALAWPFSERFKAPLAAYETHPVALGVVERSISATGAVKALVTVDVGSRLSGTIAEVKVNFNDEVKEGQLLAVIDRAPFEAKLSAASASLGQARATVSLQEATLAKSQSQFSQNERDAKRLRGLARGQAASEMSMEQAETQAAVAREEIAIAQAQLASARAVVAQREADLRQAKIDLDYTQVLSPINGVVIDRKIQPGQTVAAIYQTPILFQIAHDLSQITINTQVDEADIGAVHSGCPANFSVETYPDQVFEGVVEQVRLASVKNAGVVTYTVVVTAQNPEKRLLPDMTATVRIVCGRRDHVKSVPNEALRFHPALANAAEDAQASGQLGPEGGALWILGGDGSLRRRQVRLGLKGDTSTEVLGDELAVGDLVLLRAKSASGAEGRGAP